MALVG